MKREYTKLLLITGSALFLGFCFDILFYRKLPGISYPLFSLLILSISFLLARHFKISIDTGSIIIAMLAFILSVMVFVRTSTTLVVLDIVTSFYLFVLLLGRFTGLNLREFVIVNYLHQFFNILIQSSRECFWVFKELSGAKDELLEDKKVQHIARGLAITLPVLAIFILLLSSADLVLNKYVTDLIENLKNYKLLEHTAIIAIASFTITGMFAYAFYRARKNTVDDDVETMVATKVLHLNFFKASISLTESTILLGSINALFLIFIVLQFAYLFGGESNITLHGFTYSEYARRGFFELTMVAIFSFIITWFTDSKTEKKDVRQKRQFKALACGLIGLVLIIMISAFKRLSIYEAAYGYTTLRIYTQIFIVMLAVIFMLLLYKIVANRSDPWLSLRSLSIVIAFVIGLNIANVDWIIASLNIERFRETKSNDLLVYNMRLSEDAIDQAIISYNLLSPEKRSGINGQLKHCLNSLRNSPWQSYNLSRTRALKLLNTWEVDLNAKDKEK